LLDDTIDRMLPEVKMEVYHGASKMLVSPVHRIRDRLFQRGGSSGAGQGAAAKYARLL
jgi:hypothetical protein